MMNKKYKVKTTSLSKLLQIGKTEPEEDNSYDIYFDEQKNYCEKCEEYQWCYRLTPWEWIVIPEIVALANIMDVEVPEDPPLDISSTF